MAPLKLPGNRAELIVWPENAAERQRVAERAAQVIRAGGLVVYPTDTVYGVGADPLNQEAVARIYWAKDRPVEKAIMWLVTSLELARATCEVDAAAEELAVRYWPGPLTLVLRLRTRASAEEVPTQAFRIPDHPVALSIIDAAGGAIATTSANRSGLPAARNGIEAFQVIGDRVDLVVDAGPTPGGVESTVLDLTSNPPTILRTGPVTAEDIVTVIGAEVTFHS